MSEALKFDSKFFLSPRKTKGYEGKIQLPNGDQYKLAMFANKGPNGTWYRGDARAVETAVYDADSLAGKGTVEVRLNPFKGEHANLIGGIETAAGAFTIFATTDTYKGDPVIRGNIKPALRKPDVAEAQRPSGDAPQAGKPKTLEAG